MNRFLALLLILGLAWAQPCSAAIGTPVNIGNNSSVSVSVTSLPVSTTVDAPAGAAIIGVANLGGTATNLVVSDSAGNSYTVEAKYTATGFTTLWIFHNANPVDVPAPCTVTATETSTTLVVTAVVTCSSTDVLTVGQAISGGSFTGTISAPCTLVAGSATCTITGGATVASPGTATISSTINASWTTAGKAIIGAISVSGLATSSVRDVLGAGSIVGSPGTSSTIATGGQSQASEIIIGRVDTNGTTGTFTQAAGFSPLTTLTSGGNNLITWGYDIVANAGSVTYAPSWVTSRTFGTNIYSFKAPGGAVVPHALLLGVGP